MTKYVRVTMDYEYPPAEYVVKIKDEDLDAALSKDDDYFDVLNSDNPGMIIDSVEELKEEPRHHDWDFSD